MDAPRPIGTPPPPLDLSVVLVGAFGIASLLIGWRLVANPLDCPTRRYLYRVIQARPGVHLATLAVEVGLDPTTARYHLDRLETAGYVRCVRQGAQTLCFPANHHTNPALVHLLKDPARRWIVEQLATRPSMVQSRLATELGLSRSTVSHHTKRLRQAGLIRTRRAGKELLLFLAKN